MPYEVNDIKNHFYLMHTRLKMLTKQVEDTQELRKQLSETVSDLQRQLKNEREENKKSKKRSFTTFREMSSIKPGCCSMLLASCKSSKQVCSPWFDCIILQDFNHSMLFYSSPLFLLNLGTEYNYWNLNRREAGARNCLKLRQITLRILWTP